MTPDEVLALLQVIARQQQRIAALEAILAQAQKAPSETAPDVA